MDEARVPIFALGQRFGRLGKSAPMGLALPVKDERRRPVGRRSDEIKIFLRVLKPREAKTRFSPPAFGQHVF
jgi:hypothetical protein